MPYKDPEQRRAYHKAYRRMNRDKIRQNNLAYYRANREKNKAYHKSYYQGNKAKWRTHYEANKDKLNAYNNAYYQANKEKLSVHQKAYHDANPEKKREYNRNRRALKQSTQIEVINEKIVYLRDGWICQICKKRVNKELKHPDSNSPSLDHIIPLSKGGTHTYNNVQLAHLLCNLIKNHNILPQGEQLRMF